LSGGGSRFFGFAGGQGEGGRGTGGRGACRIVFLREKTTFPTPWAGGPPWGRGDLRGRGATDPQKGGGGPRQGGGGINSPRPRGAHGTTAGDTTNNKTGFRLVFFFSYEGLVFPPKLGKFFGGRCPCGGGNRFSMGEPGGETQRRLRYRMDGGAAGFPVERTTRLGVGPGGPARFQGHRGGKRRGDHGSTAGRGTHSAHPRRCGVGERGGSSAWGGGGAGGKTFLRGRGTLGNRRGHRRPGFWGGGWGGPKTQKNPPRQPNKGAGVPGPAASKEPPPGCPGPKEKKKKAGGFRAPKRPRLQFGWVAQGTLGSGPTACPFTHGFIYTADFKFVFPLGGGPLRGRGGGSRVVVGPRHGGGPIFFWGPAGGPGAPGLAGFFVLCCPVGRGPPPAGISPGAPGI